MYTIAALVLAVSLTAALGQDVCRNCGVEREEGKEASSSMTCDRPPLYCSNQKIDAAINTKDKKTYFFSGNYYWRLIGSEVAPGYPRLITKDWDGLPGYLDAAFTWNDGRTFFFKGSQYWSFHGRVMDPCYPRNISEGFPGVPANLDAAVLWSENKLVYLFKGTRYWRFEGGDSCPPITGDYPLTIAYGWKYMPDNVDAIFEWEDGRTYFLKDDKYYIHDELEKAPDSGKPFDMATRFGLPCKNLYCRIPY